MALHAPSVLPLEKVHFLLSLYADHGLRLIDWPYVNHQRVVMIGRSCLCPKGWPAFILHWMKGSKLKGKSSNWWGGIQSKDKQWQLSQIVGLLKDKSSLNRLSSFWDRHSIVIGLTGSMYRGLLTRTGIGKGGRSCFTVCHGERCGWSGWFWLVGAVTSNNRQETLTIFSSSHGATNAYFLPLTTLSLISRVPHYLHWLHSLFPGTFA